MVSKSSKTRKSKTKPTSGSSPSEPKLSHPHYLVVDSTLTSHVFRDCSLFTTYVPSCNCHRTVYGTDIIIEGTGNVHVRVIVSGKLILLCFRDSWHIPSSPRHFLSCSTLISWTSSHACRPFPSNDFFTQTLSYWTKSTKIHAVYTHRWSYSPQI
jgi:hypothetical protein